MYIGFTWLWVGTNGGSCEHENKPSGSVKFEILFD